MFLPPVLRPLAVPGPVDPAVLGIAEAPFSVLRGVPGSFVAERLAGALDSWQRLGDCAWLRAGDARPARLGQAFAEACRHRWPAEGLDGAPPGAVVVLELGGRWTPGTGQLLRAVRPTVIARRLSVVVVTEARFGPLRSRVADTVLPAARLAAGLPDDAWQPSADLVRMAGRRVAVLEDVRAASRLWSPAPVAEALAGARNLRTVLERLTALLLARLTPEQRAALEVAAATGYWHPQLGSPAVGVEELRPWLVPLEQQWGWLRPLWAAPLRHQLATLAPPAEQHRSALPAGRRDPRPRPRLEAHLLGPFDVRLDGSPVAGFRGRRGTSVLRYLVARRAHGCSRDELIEEFWPGVEEAAARNRLQVAVSGLRRAFREVTRLDVVEYADGGYRLNRELDVMVDVELFERDLAAGTAAERAGDRDAARAAYGRAVALYRGDFACDAPFESWTLLPRESLRLRMADALDRLSRIDLAAGRLDDCVATAHRMLDLDPCREDAHRRLMRVYVAQGQPYLALRQYELCRRLLRGTVDVDPAAETTSLYEVVRSGRGGRLPPLS